MTDVSGILDGVDRWSTADLIGRQAERTRLGDALSQAEAGRVRAVLVAGEAGIGKSRLVAAFTGDAEQAGARVLAGGCLDVGEGVLPYAPLIEAQLFISEKTASVHVSNILAKLGVENRGQAVAEATRRGLL